MEPHSRGHIVTVLVVVVHGIYLWQLVFQRLEVPIEHCVGPGAVGIDEVANAAVRLVAPSANAYLNALDGRRPLLQRLHIADVVGLGLIEHILAILADGLAVGGQRTVGLHTHIEQDDIGES